MEAKYEKNIFQQKKVFIVRGMIGTVMMLALIAGIIQFYSADKEELVSVEGRTFEKAVVTEIIRDNLQEDGTRSGEQTVSVKMLSGSFKGQELNATSADGNLFGAVCHVGMKVIVIVSATDSGQLVSVYSENRSWAVYSYILLFLLCICVIGGKNGVKSMLGLLYTFICIIFLYIPMIYRGASPFWSAVLVAGITTTVTMYLIGGYSKKTVSAMVGTVLGVLVSGISAWLFGKAAGISGYNVSNIETLLYVGQNTKIQIGGLLFSGILIASLGAVMDVAMSISSAIQEIADKNPALDFKELFCSGIRIGRDMMGTMSNTLILAFAGGSLSTLVVNYAYDLPYLQILNSYAIGIEIMQGLSGSMGVVLTVPFVSLVGAMLSRRKK